MQHSKKEIFKTTVILLLLFMLFLNFFIYISKTYIKSDQEENVLVFKNSMSFVLTPSIIEISSFNNGKTISYSGDDEYVEDLLLNSANILKSDYKSREIKLEELKNFYGVKLILKTKYNVNDFVSFFFDEKPFNNNVSEVKEIYYRELFPDKPIIRSGDSVYEIWLNDDEISKKTIKNSLKEFIENELRKTSIRYSNIELYNSDVEVPFKGYSSPAVYIIEPEYILSELVTQGDIVNRVFGAGSQFVKEAITDDRDVLYVYGYGVKSLKIAENGSLEYLNTQYNKDIKLDFSEQLSVALAFNQKMTGEFGDLVLSRYENLKGEKSSGMSFYFTKTYGDKNLNIISNDIFMRIDVVGGEVTYYYRYFPRLVKEYNNDDINGIRYDYYTIPEIISSFIPKDKIIKSFELVNYQGDFNRLRPGYKFVVGEENKNYLFDFYTKKLMED